jgi:hypothetical protein
MLNCDPSHLIGAISQARPDLTRPIALSLTTPIVNCSHPKHDKINLGPIANIQENINMTQSKTKDGRALFHRDELKFAFAATDDFVGSINPGEVFEVESEININGGVLTHLDKQLTEDDVTLPFVNPVTGPIEVKGAKAGDMLKVTIHNVAVEGIGTTALWPGVGIFPDWCRQKEFGIKNHNVLVKDGIVHWSDKVKLPVKPMIGCIATAPGQWWVDDSRL